QLNNRSKLYEIWKLYSPKIYNIVFSLPAVLLWLLLAIRAFTHFDTSWDSMYYHLPFASRLAGIFPKSGYLFYSHLEPLFDGMPKLAEMIQGFLWRTTGIISTANFFGYFSILLLTILVSTRLKIQFWMVTLFFFSIPLVLLHSVTSYTDLPANSFLSMALVNLIYAINQKNFGNKNLFFILLPLDIAANIKFQAVEIAAPFWILTFIVFLIMNREIIRGNDKIIKRRFFTGFMLVNLISVILFGLNYLVNTYRFNNPFYPLSIRVGNFQLTGPYQGQIIINNPLSIQRSTELNTADRSNFKNYLLSLSEFPLWTNNTGTLWNVEMASVWANNKLQAYKSGGFFAGNLALWFAFLLVSISVTKKKETIAGFLFILSYFIFTGLLPSSFLLRYWLFLPLNLAIILLWTIKNNPVEMLPVKKLVLILQICLFSFVIFQNINFFTSIPWKINFRSPIVNYGSMFQVYKIKVQSSDFVCVIGDTKQGFKYKLANPEMKIESAVNQELCQSSTYVISDK
ncbi:MAG: hypothetical protein WCP19_15145, partial [Chloroflexota bacterium]